MSELDEIVSRLPQGWSIWQTGDGRLVIQLRYGNVIENLEDPAITELLRKADSFKSLPRLNRCPEPILVHEWEPRKVDGKWQPFNKVTGWLECCYLKSKKECVATIERWAVRRAADIAEWHRVFDEMFPNGATQGVDFLWNGEA